jgi:hypothetical protein
MAATNKDAESLMDAVSNFGTAYTTTQESLRSTTANIAGMQGQIQMLCQAIGTGQPPPAIQYEQQHPRRPRGGRGRGQQHGGGGHNDGSHGGGGNNFGGSGGGNRNGSGGYNGGDGGHNSGGGGNGGGYGGGNTGNQPPTNPPPSLVKRFKNWNYCHTHGGDINNNHTSTMCVRPGKHHQCAVTCTNSMNGNMHGMHKTVLPSAVGCQAALTCPSPPPLNYAPTFSFPMGYNGPRFPTAPGSWGFGPQAGSYQRANHAPP